MNIMHPDNVLYNDKDVLNFYSPQSMKYSLKQIKNRDEDPEGIFEGMDQPVHEGGGKKNKIKGGLVAGIPCQQANIIHWARCNPAAQPHAQLAPDAPTLGGYFINPTNNAVINAILQQISANFFDTQGNNICSLRQGGIASRPEIKSLLGLELGHDFRDIRPKGKIQGLNQTAFQPGQVYYNYLLTHQKILLKFLEEITQSFSFRTKFCSVSGVPDEKNIFIEVLNKCNLHPSRKKFYHSWPTNEVEVQQMVALNEDGGWGAQQTRVWLSIDTMPYNPFNIAPEGKDMLLNHLFNHNSARSAC